MFIARYTRKYVRIFVVALILSISVLCLGQFGGGNGTAADPYQVATAAHLNAIRGQFLGQNIHFIQTDDIELGEAPWNQEEGWIPIGDNATRFQGTFNGGEFSINGMRINRNAQYQGLFGYASGATLQNITLDDVEIVNSGQDSGTLAGRAVNTRIDRCTASGSIISQVQGLARIGGLAGYYSGQMTRCITHVTVTARHGDRIGGLIGDSWGNVSDSYATGDVIGNNRVGGLCGNDYNHTHERVHARGNVTGNVEVGGLYGFIQTARYHDCYAMGNVTGNSQVGGLVGNYNLPENNNQQLFRSYSTGVVTGEELVGGLIGRIRPNMPGPFHCYWNTETSQQEESAGGQGLTSLQMIDRESYENWNFGDDGPWRIDPGSFPYLAMEGDQAGEHNYPTEYLPPRNFRYVLNEDRDEIRFFWNEPTLIQPIGYNFYRDGERLNEEMLEDERFLDDDVEEWILYVYAVTALYRMEDDEIEESMPAQLRIIITNFDEGDGSEDNPYTISTASHLLQVRSLLNSHFIQTDDIDLDEEEWVAIGTEQSPFTGSYNGNEFTISNLFSDSEQSYQGMFGHTSGALLTDITLENAEVSGGDNVGILAGRSFNTIINGCSAEGTVSGAANVGGLVGHYEGRMLECFAAVQVTGTGNYVGGLIGDSYGYIERCYATGNVTGESYVGGLVGLSSSVGVMSCFAIGNVEGLDNVGGLAGMVRQSRMAFCYATGMAQGRQNIGGLVGVNSSRIHFSYSIGRVAGQVNAGGLIGAQEGDATAERCYWNTRTSGQQNSAGGEGRDERHMTHPYSDDTYVDWDFQRDWVADVDYDNRGYPYLPWQPLFRLPYPDVASNPAPANMVGGVSINLEELRWSYTPRGSFTDPVGFRVYFSSTNQFDEDEFEWVDYDEEQENYACGDILPEALNHLTTYYWKVVPTTVAPDDERSSSRRRFDADSFASRRQIMSRNDAQDVPVWRFTTEIYPNPVPAVNPQPEDEATDVAVSIDQVGWTYIIDQDYRNPAGFRVYMNTTGEFAEDDDFVWVRFSAHQSNYTNRTILPEEIEYNQTYYWKVVPTTIIPDDNRRTGTTSPAQDRDRIADRRRRQNDKSQQVCDSFFRGDAENVPVWSFTTIRAEPYPLPAINPDPDHLATGVSTGLREVSWEYVSSEVYTDPVGFRVYMNMTGAFGQGAPYVWVDYVENQQRYSSSEIVPEYLDENTTYYWRVVPTINFPEERQGRNKKPANRQNCSYFVRGDAPDCPVWRFTTGSTNIEEFANPLLTELKHNYPNPFNPETTISFSLAEAGHILLEVFNINGQKVATLFDGSKEAGHHHIIWNGRNHYNQQAGSGVYFYRMKTDDYTETKRMIMIK